MKKLLGILGIVLLAFIGFKGYTYYQDTYEGTMAYAKVPEQVPTREEAKDMSDKNILNDDGTTQYTYEYEFDFIKDNQKKVTIGYGVMGKDPVPFEPGTFVKAEVSNKRVIKGPYSVTESEIPKEILEKLNQQ